MSHDYIGPKVYKIVKHEQPGSGFRPIIPITIWNQTFLQIFSKYSFRLRDIAKIDSPKGGGGCRPHRE